MLQGLMTHQGASCGWLCNGVLWEACVARGQFRCRRSTMDEKALHSMAGVWMGLAP
jgi:hypothetical protein